MRMYSITATIEDGFVHLPDRAALGSPNTCMSFRCFRKASTTTRSTQPPRPWTGSNGNAWIQDMGFLNITNKRPSESAPRSPLFLNRPCSPGPMRFVHGTGQGPLGGFGSPCITSKISLRRPPLKNLLGRLHAYRLKETRTRNSYSPNDSLIVPCSVSHPQKPFFPYCTREPRLIP